MPGSRKPTSPDLAQGAGDENSSSSFGRVITFYSYKGGTGRSMALANVACLLGRELSTKPRRVLIVDWDLEAPGLHRYFERFSERAKSSDQPGLIDYFHRIQAALNEDSYRKFTSDEGWRNLSESVPLKDYIVPDVSRGVDLMKAGRFDSNYSSLVASFDWVDLYEQYGAIFRTIRECVGSRYDWCLIDSRTGLSDASGVCTMLMPEKLVAVFTPNRQSVDGVLDLIKCAIDYRSASNDTRPLSVFPLPSRLNMEEHKLLQEARDSYRRGFEEVLKEGYGVTECDLGPYFDEVEIPHKGFYGFHELVAVRDDRSASDALSMNRAYERFCQRLVSLEWAWEIRTGAEEQDQHRPRTELVTRSVFLSSTSRELSEYREKVIDAVQRLDGWNVTLMEGFGARAWAADDFSLKMVRECDVFVGIGGFCYGSVHLPSGKSYTEREYDEAVAQNKPRLMFLAPTSLQFSAKWLIEDGNLEKQKAFRKRVNKRDTRDEFHNPDDLASRVATALQNLDESATGRWPRNPDLVHPYPLQPNFTGRIAERQWLTEWFTVGSRPVCVVEAIGGMGKSALAWFWLHADVLGKAPAGYSEAENPRVPAERRPEGVLYWSFYERDAHFGAFLDRAARYVGASDDSTSGLSDRERVDIVFDALEQRHILLILDGFERELRAYSGYRAPYQGDEAGRDGNDCVDARAAEFLQSAASLALAGRVLLTSRLFPNELTGLAGCRHELLENLAPDDVVSFFEATGVKGTRAEIAQVVAPYGGHPLSVSLLARAIVNDRKMKGDIRASGRHTVLDKLKGKHGHQILAVACDEMSDERRQLLSRIAAFRSAVDYEGLETVATLKGSKLGAALDEIEGRGLLLRDPDVERYDLHPIVRQYAYDRLADKAGVHGRLREYFEARPAPERVETLADLAPTIELYWHTVGAGHLDAAFALYRDRLAPLNYRFGAYDRQIELLGALCPEGEDRLPRLTSEGDQAWTLNALATAYGLAGQPRRAVALLERLNEVLEKTDDKINLATGVGNLAQIAQLPLGQLAAADIGLRRSIELSRGIADEFREAIDRHELGRLLAYEGRFAEAERELKTALHSIQAQGRGQAECMVWAHRSLLGLLRGDPKAALEAARASRSLGDVNIVERDIIKAEWLLGWVHTALGEPAAAEPHLNEALTRCRRINLVELEPSILLAWARLHQDRETAQKALAIADRCEYRLNQADIHNFLARLALDSGKTAEARGHAQKAKDYAYCDGPPHYYKPAHEEAERLLAEAQGASA